MTSKTDILIVGSGAAGLFCALNLPSDKTITLITKDDAENSDSFLAQGGICMLKSEEDYDSYFEDTMRAGHYENRKESVDAFLDGRNHEKYHYFCCSSGSSGNIYSFVLSHCCRKSGREKTDRNHEKRGRTE